MSNTAPLWLLLPHSYPSMATESPSTGSPTAFRAMAVRHGPFIVLIEVDTEGRFQGIRSIEVSNSQFVGHEHLRHRSIDQMVEDAYRD